MFPFNQSRRFYDPGNPLDPEDLSSPYRPFDVQDQEQGPVNFGGMGDNPTSMPPPPPPPMPAPPPPVIDRPAATPQPTPQAPPPPNPQFGPPPVAPNTYQMDPSTNKPLVGPDGKKTLAPGSQSIPLWRQLAGNILGGAVPSMAPLAEKISAGDYPGQVRRYQQNLGMQKPALDLQKEQQGIEHTKAETSETQARTGLIKTQQQQLEDDGKFSKKTNYITVGGGLFDIPNARWVRLPNDRVGQMQVNKDWASKFAPMLVPDDEGQYWVPNQSVSDSIKSSGSGQIKSLEELATNTILDQSMGDTAQKARLEQIRQAHNVLHPEAPVTHFSTDDKGRVTAVTVKPSEIAASGGQRNLGAIGATKTQPATGVILDQDAVDQNARRYLETGQLPSLGMGSAGAEARQQILNRAAQLGKDDSIAANSASTRADSSSLSAMTKSRDAVNAFEKTANANLDVFTKQAKSIIDSGSPWINQPLRSINRNLLGGKDVAAFDAARQVALTEIAKVTNNPNLTGQLSDSARKEVLALIPENATLGQIYRVVGVLRQDMENRRKFLDQGITEIKSRMGKGGENKPAGNESRKTMFARDPAGKLHEAPVGTTLPAGWKEERR